MKDIRNKALDSDFIKLEQIRDEKLVIDITDITEQFKDHVQKSMIKQDFIIRVRYPDPSRDSVITTTYNILKCTCGNVWKLTWDFFDYIDFNELQQQIYDVGDEIKVTYSEMSKEYIEFRTIDKSKFMPLYQGETKSLFDRKSALGWQLTRGSVPEGRTLTEGEICELIYQAQISLLPVVNKDQISSYYHTHRQFLIIDKDT